MAIGKASRKDFPILSRRINGKRLVYLDNAATSQKPKQVIGAISSYYSLHNSNPHRGIHTLAEESTEIYENARETAAHFIHAPSSRNIIFTRNTTESLNLVSHSIAPLLGKGNILASKMEHHSNFVPWQMLAQKTGRKLDFVPFDASAPIASSNFKKHLATPSLVAISHASNVLGTINDIAGICKYAHSEYSCPVVVDAAQSAPHIPLDVRKIGCDFLAFSGHKMLAPNIGVLYISDEWLDRLPPFLYGGGMISKVGEQTTTFASAPAKFEAGTPDVAGAAGLSAAIDYLNKIGMGKIQSHGEKLAKKTLDALNAIDGVTVFGPTGASMRTGVVSFVVEGMHAHDLGTLLDRQGIATRSGHHCAQPLMDLLGVPATSRASFYLYNDADDVEALVDGIKYAKKTFGL